MVEVADATEVSQYWRAMSGLPAVALVRRWPAPSGGLSLISSDRSAHRHRFHNDDKSPITHLGPPVCRGPNGAGDLHEGHPARTATIVTLQMQQTARPTSHGVATVRDLWYAKTDLYRRRTFLDGPALSKPE